MALSMRPLQFNPKEHLLKGGVFKTPTFIAYDYCKRETGKPTLLTLHGLASDCLGTKVEAAFNFCMDHNISTCRFDYPGHGQSGGEMVSFTLSQALQAALSLVDNVIEGDVVLMGASTGSWLALRLAQERPERIKGVLSIANACDFTQDLYWQALTPAEKEAFKKTGVHTQTYANGFSFQVGYSLIEDGATHLLFDGRSPHNFDQINCPVWLLHGLEDAIVPWQLSLRVAEGLGHKKAVLMLLPGADHQFSGGKELELIAQTLHHLYTPL